MSSTSSDTSIWYRGKRRNRRPARAEQPVEAELLPLVDGEDWALAPLRGLAVLKPEAEAAINQAIESHAGYEALGSDAVARLFSSLALQTSPATADFLACRNNANSTTGKGKGRQEAQDMSYHPTVPKTPSAAWTSGQSNLNPLAPIWNSSSPWTYGASAPRPTNPGQVQRPPSGPTERTNPLDSAGGTPQGNSTGLAIGPRTRPATQQQEGGHSFPPAGRPSRPFIPMTAVERSKKPMELSAEEVRIRKEKGIPLTYQGDITNPLNLSAEIPADKNTSLWISGLPPTCSTRELLGSLAIAGPFGRIFATAMAPPARGHDTAAAKVQFFDRAGAQRLFDRAMRAPLVIGGSAVLVRWNRHRTGEMELARGSRVLVIAGRADLVHPAVLEARFRTYFVFQTETIIVRKEDYDLGTRVLEWRFGSFRAQADAARKVLDSDEFNGVTAWFERDPCE